MRNYSRGKNESMTQEDADRIADILDKDSRYNTWSDEEGFREAYSRYLRGTTIDTDKAKRKVWERYKNNPTIRGSHKRIVLFNIKQERTLKKYEKGKVPRGRRNQPVRITIKVKGQKVRVRTFKVLARQKGRTVYARKIKTKVGFRYVSKEGWRAKRI